MAANSVSYIRQLVDAKPTPNDKGLEMTIKIVAYDRGIVNVNANAIGQNRNDNQWLSVNRCIGQMLEEFGAQVAKRQDERRQDDEPAVIVTVPSLDDAAEFLNN